MKTLEWHDPDRAEDRARWGPGPWDGEPDKVQWPDPATGYACLIHRNRMGALCGYVGVPEGHPWHGLGYSDVGADVHGGLSYADVCDDVCFEERGICHLPGPGEPEHLWWVGFDCAQFMDLVPSMARDYADLGMTDPNDGSPGWRSTYRTIAYVKSECARLARQAADAR